MATPRVSVLIPVRDAAAFLPACLRSVARQTLDDFECVVVDDGSQDGSAELAGRAARSDPRFRPIAAARRGLVPALARGLAACRGEFVARMDADDVMHRERLAAQVAALEREPGLDAVGSHVRLFPRAALAGGMRRYESWLAGIASPQRVREEAFVECPIAHPTLCARRATLARFGYRDLGWPEDYDLVLRVLATGGAIGVVPRRLVAWRERPERLSRTHPAYALARFTACKAHFLARGLLAGGEEYLLWGHGPTGRALKRALAREGRRPAAIVEVHPRRLGRSIDGAPVIAPDALARRAGQPLVVAVSGAAARAEIRAALAALGWRETLDYVCAA